MKTLKDHVILYDAECPMCKAYTRAFTHTGMLDEEGRAPYQDMPGFACPLVDRRRAVNEIALVNRNTGEVSYGIDSLFKVIGNAFPFFSPLFRFRPFSWLMHKCYAFISYNRKVIIPGSRNADPGLQPDFSLRYRLFYLLFTVLVAGAILSGYTKLLAGILPQGGPLREYSICGGQVLFQGLIITGYAPACKWDYLGNMMTISLAGSLLLAPILLLSSLLPISAGFAAGYFLVVAGLMLLEHIRRSSLLSLGWLMTASWITYRLAMLAVIYLCR